MSCEFLGLTDVNKSIARLYDNEKADVTISYGWIMKNQLSRRNLNDFQRIEIMHKCEDVVRAKAKERQIRKPADFVVDKFPQQNQMESNDKKSRDELGSMAGVSGKTYERATDFCQISAKSPISAFADFCRTGKPINYLISRLDVAITDDSQKRHYNGFNGQTWPS